MMFLIRYFTINTIRYCIVGVNQCLKMVWMNAAAKRKNVNDSVSALNVSKTIRQKILCRIANGRRNRVDWRS